MTGFDALTPPSPRLLGPTPLNEKPAPALPASVAAAVAPAAAAAEMAPADESFATSPDKANFAPKGDVNFGDKSPDAAPVPAGDKKIPDFVKEIMKKKEQAATYRVGQDQSKDRLDQRVADPHLSLPEAVKGAQDALDQLNLPPEQRQAVQQQMAALMGKLSEPQKQEAAVYLQELFSKRGQALGGEKLGALVGQVSAMASRSYDPRVGDSAAFALSSLRDIAAPDSISQGTTNACAAASIQTQLALTDPQRYLQMADTLAQGQAFEGLAPNWSFSRETGRASDTGRSISAKLMQNTIMEAGRDHEGQVLNSPSKPGVEDYDSTLLPGPVPLEEGAPQPGENLSEQEKARLSGGTDEMGAVGLRRKVLPGTEDTVLYHSGQIDGKPEYAESDDVRNVSQKAQVDLLRQAAPSRENPILVNILHPESNLHAMTAIGMDQEAVTLINTATGGVERIPIADFEKLVVGVYVPKIE